MLSLNRLRMFPWKPAMMRLCSVELVNKDYYIEKLRKNYAEQESKNIVVPVFKKAMLYPDDVAVKDERGEFTFFQLFMTAKLLSIQISNICGSASGRHVAFLCPHNVLWVAIQWACWMSGQVAVPLKFDSSKEQLQRLAADCKAKLLIGTPDNERQTQDLAKALDTPIVILDHGFVPALESLSSTEVYAKQLVDNKGEVLVEGLLSDDFYSKSPAMLLYTSLTASTQKAVLLSHDNITAQMRILSNSWKLQRGDCLLAFMSMVRMHSLLGALLGAGGKVLFQNFECHTAWSTLLGINSPVKQRVNIFMAKPLYYKRLLADYEKIFGKDAHMVEYILSHCKSKTRLMATAYALLPDSVFERWRQVTNHTIHEYYGNMASGLVLGPQLDENFQCNVQKPGTLGMPLEGVAARLVDNAGKLLMHCKTEAGKTTHLEASSAVEPSMGNPVGELQISGPSVFAKYLNDNTLNHMQDGFYKTGDLCAYQNGNLNFLSKARDVFVVGGLKVYSSEIKKVLITHPDIKDVAVLGIPSKVWGHILGVVCIMLPEAKVDLETLKSYCNSQLPIHKRPTIFKAVPSK